MALRLCVQVAAHVESASPVLGDRTEAVESVEVAEDAGEGGETPAAGGMAPSVLGEPGKDMCVQSMSAFFFKTVFGNFLVGEGGWGSLQGFEYV